MAGLNLRALYESGKSLPEIERVTGIARSTVRCRLLKDGVKLRTRAEGVRLFPDHGKHLIGKKRHVSPETRAVMSASRQRWANDNAKGTSKKASGYVVFTRGENKHRGEHDVMMERRIGRRLKPNEIVHHIDGNRSNNDEDNLALMTRAAHARLHRREERLSKGKAA